MSFAIFDENFYLSNNPDVKAAVDAGAFSSGLQHFQQNGLAEGRVLVSPFYDEEFYLQTNPDVAAAVDEGALSSGLQHFIDFGEAEGRSSGLIFDEEFYLQTNPDVAAAVDEGALSSGLQHFILFGKEEGRSRSPLNEEVYLELNPDVAAAVNAETFSSGLQHYEQYGQFENDRIALFSGTSGNDVITGFGEGSSITGIDVTKSDEGTVKSENGGDGEVDTLIGGAGTDLFILGASSSFQGIPQAFYDGGGSADYAVIRNFEPGSDTIQVAGYQSFFYNLKPVNGSVNISTIDGDLIAIVEGVTSLSPLSGDSSPGTFQYG